MLGNLFPNCVTVNFKFDSDSGNWRITFNKLGLIGETVLRLASVTVQIAPILVLDDRSKGHFFILIIRYLHVLFHAFSLINFLIARFGFIANE